MLKKYKIPIIIGSSVLALIVIFILSLPYILKSMGYHPDYERIEYDLPDKKALIVTTSHDTLGTDINDPNGDATGLFPSEMTIPYYEFLDAGMTVDLASIQGGEIPLEPIGLRRPLRADQDNRFYADEEAMEKLNNSLKIDDVDFLEYDVIFLSGGWGAAYDLGTSEILGEKITEANREGKILGSVCHGALGFILAEEVDGRPLVEGKTMTGVTDKQVDQLGIGITPQHPEEELRKLNANFVSSTGTYDFFETYVAVDGNIITGQNQNSSGETAQEILKLLNEQN